MTYESAGVRNSVSMEGKSFVNYYEILDLAPSASSAAIERRFRVLARQYHPDNQATGDRSKFDAIIEAHDTLKDATRRAQYHDDHQQHLPPFTNGVAEESDNSEMDDSLNGGDRAGLVDSLGIDRDISVQNNILILLYLRRRRNIREPGVGNAELERLTGCPHEQLEFHIWYLREKGWISPGENGLLAITIDGVDRAALIYQESANKLITVQS